MFFPKMISLPCKFYSMCRSTLLFQRTLHNETKLYPVTVHQILVGDDIMDPRGKEKEKVRQTLVLVGSSTMHRRIGDDEEENTKNHSLR